MQQQLKAEIAAAMDASRHGRTNAAIAGLRALAQRHGQEPHILHALGTVLLAGGRASEAIEAFSDAVALDPKAAVLWFALARAFKAASNPDREMESLDRALAIDPYMLPALLQKAQALEKVGRTDEAAAAYRALLKTTPDTRGLPEPTVRALDHGRSVIAADDARRAHRTEDALGSLLEDAERADSMRVRTYLDGLAGRRIYFPEPTGACFPFLPAYEYFPRDLFPWFDELEAATDTIRTEFLSLRGRDAAFAPYVQFAAGVPLNQWGSLNHSPDWGAFFLWRDGERIDDNCKLCPGTTAVMERLPLLDVPGRAPTVMFSLLQPRTRIPAHTGTTNTRVTIHLPLVVPSGCGFRVGGETRVWREGEAWAFDDTIEHEAWNASDRPRAILIIDGWNPLLSTLEKDVIRALARHDLQRRA